MSVATETAVALVALALSLVGPILGYLAAKRNLAHEIATARVSLETQISVSERELATQTKIAQDQMLAEHRFNISSYEVIRKLLTQKDWKLRTFGALKTHLPGFDDNELRKLLIGAGALSFRSVDGNELWGLLERNEDELKPVGKVALAVAPVVPRLAPISLVPIAAAPADAPIPSTATPAAAGAPRPGASDPEVGKT